MNIWEIDKLLLFLIFIIPGFISLKTYELLIPNTEKDSSKQIIDAIAYSCINYAFLLMPIIYIEKSSASNTSPILYYVFYLFVFFIIPIILVIIWKWIREGEKFQTIAQHPISKPWDYIFSQNKYYWIKIILTDGKIIGGKYAGKSFTSSSPAEEQIYLEESWIINDKGGFDRAKIDTEGIMVMQNQISHIEFIKNKE